MDKDEDIYNFFREIEQKWQKVWEETKIYEPEIDYSKKKFFITVPYPYASGLLHLGSAYTFSRGDFLARYKRLRGFNVLWPQGWHITGAPIVGRALMLKEGNEKVIRDLKSMGIPEEDWEQLKTPEGWAMYFVKQLKKDFKSFGFSIDWRREFYTTYLNPAYSKFIEWQYRKLKEKGLITKGKHPVVWDPKVQKVIGDHDRPDEFAGIGPIEGYIIKFSGKYKNKDVVFPCFTLRPETVYGVTNIWLNPEAKYVLAKVNNEYWIVPNTIVIEELKGNGLDVEVIEDINVMDLFGKEVKNPVTKEKVPILPAKFVDPEIGTGIVMSVPAHAPYDYIGLMDLTKDYKWRELAENCLKNMKSLFKVEGFSEYPAKDIVERMRIKSQDEKEKLEKATQEIYSKEFYNGVLREIYGKYSGKRIEEVKDEIAEEFIENNIAVRYYTLPIRFKSRYGGVCIIKIVENQWFLRYSDPEWKEKAHRVVEQMRTIPPEIKEDLHRYIDWYRDWACTHQRELGTPLPWDPEWTIESLSDSTIYMAYYIIAKYLQHPEKYGIDINRIEDSFFDYVFLGRGNIEEVSKKTGVSKELLEEMRKEFEYWYPVDIRTSGKDLIQNHFIFFIFHHAAIFPEKYWPKGIAINGWVLMEGRKMSKSLGNVILMRDSVRDYSADIIRFLLAYAGNSGFDDANIEIGKASKVAKELKEWYEFAISNWNKGREERKMIDDWFESEISKTLIEIENEYENMNFKNVLVKGFYELNNKFKWYHKRTNGSYNKGVIRYYIEAVNSILYPIVPHLVSEILEKIYDRDYALDPKWPEVREIRERLIKAEEYIMQIREDIIRISNLIKKKEFSEIKIIVASEEKEKIFRKIKELLAKGIKLNEISKEIVKYFDNKELAFKLGQKVLKNQSLIENIIDRKLEIEALKEAKEFLEREFKSKVIIETEEESSEEKAKNALPGKPAIILS